MTKTDPRLGHLTDYLERNARDYSDKPALIAGTARLTWSELDGRVDRVAARLSPYLGDADQQIVAVSLPNTWQSVVIYLAILKLGHIALPISASYKPLEVEAVLSQVPPALVISNDPISHPGLTVVRAADLLGDAPGDAAPADPPKLRLAADEQIATIFFTSGTTGKPKAAPYTHANHLWNIGVSSELWEWTGDDSLLISLPLSHWYGLVMGLSGALYHANTVYLHERFDAQKTLDTLSSGEVTIHTHAPMAYAKLLEHDPEGEYDLTGVRLFISGSSALPPRVWEGFKERFGHEIIEAYGSSETGRIGSNPLDLRLPGSAGRPLHGVEVRTSPDGELLVRSPGLFPGYHQNDEATREKSTPGGWWRTGDLGELRGGYIYLKGRVQEKINKRGFSVSPRDVEWALLQHPEIREVYVLGERDDRTLEDRIVALVVARIERDTLDAHLKQNLPAPWRPDRVIFVDEIPRTHNGKPQLAKLRALAQQPQQ